MSPPKKPPRMKTAGPVVREREGWCLNPLSRGALAHFYRWRNSGSAVAICDSYLFAHLTRLLWSGTWRHCKRCEAKLAREAAIEKEPPF